MMCRNTLVVFVAVIVAVLAIVSVSCGPSTPPGGLSNPPQIGTATATPSSTPNDSIAYFWLTVAVSDPDGLGDIASVTVDLDSIGKSAAELMYDDGDSNHGDATVGDGVYSCWQGGIGNSILPGTYNLEITATDNSGAAATDNVPIEVFKHGPVIFVDASNTSGIENGTQAHPYDTLGEGTEAALNTAGDGYTVSVASGTYLESVMIVESMILRGAGSQSTIIDGNNSFLVIEIYYADNTEISGFTIANGQNGVQVESSSEVIISQCDIRGRTGQAGQAGHGIWVLDASSLVAIRDNTFRDNKCGIFAEDVAGLDVKNNVISNSVVVLGQQYPWGRGMELHRCSSVVIEDNTVSNNEGTGIALDECYGDVTGNTIKGNGEDGILSRGGQNLITYNIFSHNAEDGISIVDSSAGTVANNTISDSGVNGIKLLRATSIEINDNEVKENTDDGIHIEDSSAEINGNEIRNNGSDGIFLKENSTANIIVNKITGNGGYGINCNSSSTACTANIMNLKNTLGAVNNCGPGCATPPSPIAGLYPCGGELPIGDFWGAKHLFTPPKPPVPPKANGRSPNDLFEATINPLPNGMVEIILTDVNANAEIYSGIFAGTTVTFSSPLGNYAVISEVNYPDIYFTVIELPSGDVIFDNQSLGWRYKISTTVDAWVSFSPAENFAVITDVDPSITPPRVTFDLIDLSTDTDNIQRFANPEVASTIDAWLTFLPDDSMMLYTNVTPSTTAPTVSYELVRPQELQPQDPQAGLIFEGQYNIGTTIDANLALSPDRNYILIRNEIPSTTPPKVEYGICKLCPPPAPAESTGFGGDQDWGTEVRFLDQLNRIILVTDAQGVFIALIDLSQDPNDPDPLSPDQVISVTPPLGAGPVIGATFDAQTMEIELEFQNGDTTVIVPSDGNWPC